MKVSEEAVRERTGRGWDEWFTVLDAWGGVGRAHGDIARWLVEEQEIDNWWAQSVTVEYERARGMRAPNQARGGGFQVTASRTIDVPVDRLYAAFADASLRARWLPDCEVRVRTATAPRTWRADLDGKTRLVVGFVSRSDGKSQVALAHEKLAGAAEVERLRIFWRERLGALKQLLAGQTV